MRKRAISRNLIGAALAAGLIFAAAAPPATAQESPAAPNISFKPKSETTATVLSLVGTVVPWALYLSLTREETYNAGLDPIIYLSLAAMPIGPSLGHFYAGSKKRAWGGIGLRAASMAAMIGGLYWAFNEELDAAVLPLTLILGSGAVLIASSVADIVDAHKSARRYNYRGNGLSMAVAPVLSPRTKAVGLQANISF